MSARDAWSSREVPTLRGGHVLLRRLIPADIEDRRVLGRNAEENRMYGGSLRADEPMTLCLVREGTEVDGGVIGLNGGIAGSTLLGSLRSNHLLP
jgi:hypothetical protein